MRSFVSGFLRGIGFIAVAISIASLVVPVYADDDTPALCAGFYLTCTRTGCQTNCWHPTTWVCQCDQ